MKKTKHVKKITRGIATQDGDGVKLVRVIGHADTAEFDPFLMLDAFDSDNPEDYIKGFPWHPHRGIETITYLIQGEIEHGDSLGNKGTIRDGDCQWMTAGSGIIHQEMPQASSKMLGTQLWLNLPAKHKMTKPRYGDILSKDVPVIKNDGVTVKIIAGEYEGTDGAFFDSFVKATYLDVQLDANVTWQYDANAENTFLLYILLGEGTFDPSTNQTIEKKHAVLFDDGESFVAKAGANGLRFLLLSAKPLKEPIAWGGPIVMNTQQELKQAFDELENNTFIKTK